MPGFSSSASTSTNVVFANNADFTGNPPAFPNPSDTNGLQTDGQLWIGSTAVNAGNTHINVGRITSPLGTIIPGFASPNITLDVVGGGFLWVDASGAIAASKSTGYFITGTATATLPAVASQGDTIKFFVDHASQVLTIDAPGTQIIRMGELVTSAGGTAVSTVRGDSVVLVYRASNTCWCAVDGFTGTWTIS